MTTEQLEFARMWKQQQNMNGGCGTPIYILLIIFLLASCATRTKIEYRDRDVNHYVTNTVHDTLRIETADSTYHKIIVRNDTVYDTKYKERTRWRDRIVERHDTCWRDSIVTYKMETTKEIVKYPKTYWWFAGISIISFIFAFVKLFRWLKMF